MINLAKRKVIPVQTYSAARRIMSMKNSNGTTENQTHHLLAHSTMTQPAGLPHAPLDTHTHTHTYSHSHFMNPSSIQ
jgi:hypothetical protein